MNLKYHYNLKTLTNCPPNHYKPKQLLAYRFIFNDLNHPHNFLPVLLINPSRIHTPKFRSNDAKCQGYGLSLYDTLAHAQTEYTKIAKYYPAIRERQDN